MKPTHKLILESLEPVIASSKFVKIIPTEIKKLAEELKNEPVPPWDNNLQFLGTSAETLQYYFFLDSINFCFWAPKGKERWHHKINGEKVTGYYAFSVAIKDAFLRDKRFFDAAYLAEISETDFRSIFKGGGGELLLQKERWNIIRENFSISKNKFNGSVLNLITHAERDVDELVNLLIDNFPTFRDQVELEGKSVYFLKRAQIFPSDLSFALPHFPLAQFTNMENLTIFADYKLPQIVEAFEVLQYAPELEQDILEEWLIPAGSQKEIEIRANTIFAIEQIGERMRQKGGKLSTHEVDWVLWVKAKQMKLPRPHHKTLTTFY